MLAPSASKYPHTFDHTQLVFITNFTAITEEEVAIVDTTAATGNIEDLGCSSRDYEEEVVGAANLQHFKYLKSTTNPIQRQFLTAIATIEDLRLLLLVITANMIAACNLVASSYVGSADNTCYSVAEVDTQDGSMASDLANTIAITIAIANIAHSACYFQSLSDFIQLYLISHYHQHL